MRDAANAVATGEVTIASRDVQLNGIAIRKGDWLGLAGGKPIAGGGDLGEVTYAVVDELLQGEKELLTLLVGEDEEPLEALLGRIAEAHPSVTVDVQEGGQPHYALLLSAE
jgi:dihydroxyacetone kinase-like predicted kinase